jgi:hypothetical protein
LEYYGRHGLAYPRITCNLSWLLGLKFVDLDSAVVSDYNDVGRLILLQ